MTGRGRSRAIATGVALLTGLILGGCGESGPERAADPSPTEQVDELGRHDGEVCPELLPEPQGDRGHGPAEEAPSLPAPERAWVCEYHPPGLAEPGADAEGTRRVGPAVPVEQAELDRIATHLDELRPAAADRTCTMDLGPQYLLVYTVGNDLTGVLVDAFGCQDVRLTDEPFLTPPGEGEQAGVVPGVLTGPPGLLTALTAAAGAR